MSTRRVLLLASLPIRVLLSLLAALQFYLSLLLRTLLFFTAAPRFVASLTLTVLFRALLLLGALLILILPNALLILLPAGSLLFLILIDTLAILLPSVLLLGALLILLCCALRLALLLLRGALLSGLLLRLLSLLLLRGAALFLLGPTLGPSILICLFRSWLIRRLSLALLPTLFSTATAALSTCDVAGADQHCESKRCRRCEALVIDFHLFTPLNLVAPLRLTRYQHWQTAFQRGKRGEDGFC